MRIARQREYRIVCNISRRNFRISGQSRIGYPAHGRSAQTMRCQARGRRSDYESNIDLPGCQHAVQIDREIHDQLNLDRGVDIVEASKEGWDPDRKSTRLNSSHTDISRMPS